MTTQPLSLVQIHYHDRPGGVRQVMEWYSSFFNDVAGGTAPNYRVLAESGMYFCSYSRGVDVPAADYHQFYAEHAFYRMAGQLTGILMRFLNSDQLVAPVAVVGHNLCLGKNPALAAAFTRCAILLGGTGEAFRFYSVLHDFPSDGRRRFSIPVVHKTGKALPFEKYLYSVDAPVHFIVPSSISADITGLSSRELSVLPNPYRLDLAADNRTDGVRPSGSLRSPENWHQRTGPVVNLKEQFEKYATTRGCTFKSALPMYCYPSRIIHRKNLFEAFLYSTVLLGGSLVTGAAGQRASDRRRMKTLTELARRYRVSFLCDTVGIVQELGFKSSKYGDPFGMVISAADACVTTSLSEGFGYALVAPWCFGKNVLGRLPSGTSLLKGMVMADLYTRLPIPVSWVSVEQVHTFLSRSYKERFGRPFQPLRQFTAEVIINETIDFALLSEAMQVAVLTRVLGTQKEREQLVDLLREPIDGWGGLARQCSCDSRIIEKNKRIVNTWSRCGFKKAFMDCLSRIPCKPVQKDWYTTIDHYFSTSSRFRPHW